MDTQVNWDALREARLYDLAQPIRPGMPVSPNHAPFQLALVRRHGDRIRPDGGSAANEIMVTGGHIGTHLDALCHVSQDGLLFGGVVANEVQGTGGFSALGIDTVDPIFCRGILLDVAGLHGVECLSPAYEVTANDLESAATRSGVEVRTGDAVLVRTGWSKHWEDPQTFVGLEHGVPGLGVGAAEWLRDHRVHASGGETIAFEVVLPGVGHRTMPVHRILLVEAGIHIIEAMNLQELARDGQSEFVFLAAPLKIAGATGSPIRPLAIVWPF